MKGTGQYTDDWNAIATKAKDEAEWRCVRCKHPAELPGERIPCDELCDASRHFMGRLNDGKQRILTVHHLTGAKDQNAWWNTVVLCQRCHLQIQGKVIMDRCYMFEHSEWFKPYVAGFYAYKYLGLQLNRDEVMSQLDELLNLERVL